MLQAGVILSDYATLMVEILKDNARPEAGAVYGPWTWAGPSSLDRSPRPTANNRYAGGSPAPGHFPAANCDTPSG